jgi:hypothetical protein
MSWTLLRRIRYARGGTFFIVMLCTADFSAFTIVPPSGREHLLLINSLAADILALANLVRHRPGAARASTQHSNF